MLVMMVLGILAALLAVMAVIWDTIWGASTSEVGLKIGVCCVVVWTLVTVVSLAWLIAQATGPR
jgi:hypothetical protein